ncbi:hypothetical protein G6F46_001584 [Rhizopus delemar]|nr:hypothetical protein G6F43_005563 [Rhizopus delemar]KAG1551445.1 hypothetical protein G6F51_001849 [Rhizopus arrhizus]KAG1464351.1 hypothetical protein G6F55_001838 [Rhizopus delemar]KAG1500420.1 hypothetical protein G6F54_003725 [Rhizopus delemar]KAG1512929.1 hypothetical protein G6F52_010290 [Rhizopus delemar]
MSVPIIIGARFSTYTRTIRMALTHLNVPYQLEKASPHSELAFKHNPFGRIPSLLHNDKVIFETMAIRDYIDAQFSDKLTPKDLETKMKMTQMISILSDYVFHHVILNFAKYREACERQGKSGEELSSLLKPALIKAINIIKTVEQMVPQSDFLCGNSLTWADYFFYPVAADIYVQPEKEEFIKASPKLFRWYKSFEMRKEAIQTYPGTVADKKANKSNI